MLCHVPLHLVHALLRWTVSEVLPATPPAEVRPECVSQKIESLPPRIPEARLLLVQCQSQPLQHPPRPSQCLCRFTATEDHKVSSPGESHPEALSEPYLNLSAHTAP